LSDKKAFRTTIGGQAVMEGIMMRGPGKAVVAVRTSEGLHFKDLKVPKTRSRKHILAWPFIRGIVIFVSSMRLGFKALNYSADLYASDIEADGSSKVDKWFEEHKGAQTALTVFAMIVGLALAVVLFTVLPTILGRWMKEQLELHIMVRGLVEGLLRVVILLLYMIFVSKLKDIQRVFAYHGAEHKAISCYEAGKELTLENVRSFSRLHPRCGTSFLLNVIIISMVVFLWVTWDEWYIRVALRLSLLPVVVCLAYEFNRWAGRHENVLSRILRKPGMWLQKITTREPDDGMIELGIEALKQVAPEAEGSDAW
jgi:uncharacterized protein YqhQ